MSRKGQYLGGGTTIGPRGDSHYNGRSAKPIGKFQLSKPGALEIAAAEFQKNPDTSSILIPGGGLKKADQKKCRQRKAKADVR